MIQFRICIERWSMIDLDQVWFQLTIKHDVEPEYFEAHVAMVVIGLAGFVQV